MFITTREKAGTCYLEFQFCKIKNPVKLNKVDVDVIENWKEDSLLITDDDFEEFYKLYGDIFNCALFPNGKKGFFNCGVNYYDKESAELILSKLKNNIEKRYIILIAWLEESIKKYNGFYILGI